jgi:dTMP kinase
MSGAKFITVEGIEGVGKSTQVGLLSEYLRSRGISVLVTREPGGTQVGEHIRELLLKASTTAIHPETELLLMFAARAEHLHQVILPALATSRWVVCDRFTDASYAYQGGGRGIAAQRIAALEQWLLSDWRPHLTLLLDASVETAWSRIKGRQDEDRFERESTDFFVRVRRTYLELAAREPHRFCVIDADAPLDQVRRAAIGACDRLINGG